MNRLSQHVLAYVICAVASLVTGCAAEEPYTKETFVMGTKAWVTIAGMSDRDAERAAEAAFREMYRIESVMSTWRSKSEISRLNAESDGKPHKVSRELYTLIDSSFYYSKMTAGAFDITVRPVVLLWGFEGGAPKLPSEEEIARARALVGYEKVALHCSDLTVTLPKGMQIDLAGVAKGYAVDRCAAVLEALGVTNGLVNIGGNIFALGSSPNGRGWKIGIRDPRGGAGTVGTLLLSNEAVATSANYENFVELEGHRYGHLMDPRTGRPVSHVLSVTVVAPTGLESDALSTGLFVLGPEEARQAVSALKGVKALYAKRDGTGIIYQTLGDLAGRLSLENGKNEKEEK